LPASFLLNLLEGENWIRFAAPQRGAQGRRIDARSLRDDCRRRSLRPKAIGTRELADAGRAGNPHFLCPFCLTTFGKEAVLGDSKQVILAHCTPEAVGGRLLTLACDSCDCSAGHEIDIHLINRLLHVSRGIQGQRPLSCCSGEGLHEELIIPSAAAAFHGQAVFTRMLFEQR